MIRTPEDIAFRQERKGHKLVIKIKLKNVWSNQNIREKKKIDDNKDNDNINFIKTRNVVRFIGSDYKRIVDGNYNFIY